MLWREIELSTFDVGTLRDWVEDLYGEIRTIEAEINRRGPTPEGVTGTFQGPPTDPRPLQGRAGSSNPLADRPTRRPTKRMTGVEAWRKRTRGHPPAETKTEGKESLPGTE